MLFTNINGIQTNNVDQECHQIGHTAAEYNIDYLGLVETNLNWSNIMITEKVKSILRKYWHQTLLKCRLLLLHRPRRIYLGEH